MCLRVVLFLMLVGFGCGKHLPTGTSLSSHPVQGEGTTAGEWVGGGSWEWCAGEAFKSQMTFDWFSTPTEAGAIARIKYQLEFTDRTETVADIELRHRKYLGQEGDTTTDKRFASFSIFPRGAPANSDLSVGSAVSASAFYYFDLRVSFMDTTNGRYVEFGSDSAGYGTLGYPIHGMMILAKLPPSGHCRLTWVDYPTNEW